MFNRIIVASYILNISCKKCDTNLLQEEIHTFTFTIAYREMLGRVVSKLIASNIYYRPGQCSIWIPGSPLLLQIREPENGLIEMIEH